MLSFIEIFNIKYCDNIVERNRKSGKVWLEIYQRVTAIFYGREMLIMIKRSQIEFEV